MVFIGLRPAETLQGCSKTTGSDSTHGYKTPEEKKEDVGLGLESDSNTLDFFFLAWER